MNRVSSIFSQMLKLVPATLFDRAVSKHRGERHSRGFRSWDQFVAMPFASLARPRASAESKRAGAPPRAIAVNKRPLILLAIVICLLPCVQARASVSGGCWMPCAVFDEVLAQAKADPNLRWAALRLLRASAEGRAMEIDAETLQPFRILEEAVEAGEMSGENSRVAAFLAIGRLGSPAAREYLDAITKDQFAEAEREALWRSVQIDEVMPKRHGKREIGGFRFVLTHRLEASYLHLKPLIEAKKYVGLAAHVRVVLGSAGAGRDGIRSRRVWRQRRLEMIFR